MPKLAFTPEAVRDLLLNQAANPEVIKMSRAFGCINYPIFLLDELKRVEAFHLARAAGRELPGVELGDGPDATRARAQRVPVGLGADAERRHQANA